MTSDGHRDAGGGRFVAQEVSQTHGLKLPPPRDLFADGTIFTSVSARWTVDQSLARLNKNCQTLIEAPRVTHLADAGEESSSFHRVLLTG